MRYTNYTVEEEPQIPGAVRVSIQCPFCPKKTNITCMKVAWDRWETDKHHVQDVFPTMTADDREALISGMCIECWDQMEAATDEDDGPANSEGLVTKDAITCPACGGTGPFRYLEDVVNYREVIGQRIDENLVAFIDVEGLYKVYDETGHPNPRLECQTPNADGIRTCLHEFKPIDCNGNPVEFEFH